jgi:nitrite reductase/ring-hydroxylating ferredoxin subunit
MTQKLSRRSFLILTGVTGGAFLLSGCGLGSRVKGVPQTQLPQIDGAWTYSDGTLTLDLAKLPELDDLGGAVRIEGDVLPEPILVFLGEDENYYAFKNVCTHAGRMIDPVAGTMTLQCCSVNRSTFDYEGSVIGGPAEGSLTGYPLTVEEGQLLITLS